MLSPWMPVSLTPVPLAMVRYDPAAPNRRSARA